MTLFVDTSVWPLAFRRAGVQIGTIDALLAQLYIRHGLTLLTSDHGFVLAAAHCPLRIWEQSH